MLKKAAMFGLDARIALAIFGALSVISGAALYSAIQESRVTKNIVELKELLKAWEQYYLDTGSMIPMSTNTVAQSANLAEDKLSLTSWQGPYVSYTAHGLGLRATNGNDYHIMRARTDLYWDSPSSTDDTCITTEACYIWARIYDHADAFDDGILTAIDKRIDNSDGAEKGEFRWSSTALNLRGPVINYE
tara:strand:+ start:589 stop:1158 length:570 start_codon:yes stop_codon:yes gene_type:complete